MGFNERFTGLYLDRETPQYLRGLLVPIEDRRAIAHLWQESPQKEPGKYAVALPGTFLEIGERKIPGMFVVDVKAPIVKEAPQDIGVGPWHYARVAEPIIPGEIHKEDTDLWIYLAGEAVMICGGTLVEDPAKPHQAGAEERTGTHIKGGLLYKLTSKSPRFLVPRGMPHQHGTIEKVEKDGEIQQEGDDRDADDGIVGAIVFKLTPEEAAAIRRDVAIAKDVH